jgi:hypothetical protein
MLSEGQSILICVFKTNFVWKEYPLLWGWARKLAKVLPWQQLTSSNNLAAIISSHERDVICSLNYHISNIRTSERDTI